MSEGEEKGNYFPGERYEQKLWNITVAPSSNGEQGLAGTVLPSLPQSLRQGLHGRGLLLLQQGKRSHTLGMLRSQKCDAAYQEGKKKPLGHLHSPCHLTHSARFG